MTHTNIPCAHVHNMYTYNFARTQVVTTLNYIFTSSEHEKGPFLVVVPLTTIEHWRREVEAWTEMNLCMYHDNGGRDMRDLIREYEWYYSGRYVGVCNATFLLSSCSLTRC